MESHLSQKKKEVLILHLLVRKLRRMVPFLNFNHRQLHLVTVATHSEGYLPVLEQQAKEKGLTLVKLGLGKEYSGHFMKDLEMKEYLKTIPSHDLVIFVDGFDSLMLGDINEILEKYKKLDAKLVLSVENVGVLSFIHAAIFERVLGKYINTGLYMGEAGFLLKFLETMYSRDDYNRSSNQKTWCNHLHKLQASNNLKDIKLDKESDIFLNHSFTTSNYPKMKGKRIELKKHQPCFIQGNGREDMSYIIKATGHGKYNKHKGEYWLKKMKYNMRAVFKVYNPILTFYIYLCILALVLAIFLIVRWRRKSKDTHFYIG
jgi:hypothetical protein